MSPTPRLADRVAALEAAFRHIAGTRMQGVPLLNERLAVQAVGFQLEAQGEVALGVLVTPWFMNLVRLPLRADAPAALAVGAKSERDLGNHALDFIGAHEQGLGAYEIASLYSPMFEFADQAAAIATASEVLTLLRVVPPATGQAAPPSRRGFLFGRTTAAQVPP